MTIKFVLLLFLYTYKILIEYFFVIKNARGNNLQGVDLRLPIGLFTCVTGVSGSGKSTLVNNTLYNAIAKFLYRSNVETAAHDAMEGMNFFDKVVDVKECHLQEEPSNAIRLFVRSFTKENDFTYFD